ncbi:MAG: hypothetical protein K8W52_30500 [Deltaproteobacteria bacterium]|nr:hypothetical protein [Deltaproteobacteria bacterium]
MTKTTRLPLATTRTRSPISTVRVADLALVTGGTDTPVADQTGIKNGSIKVGS